MLPFGFPVSAPPFAQWKANKVGGSGLLKDLTWEQVAVSDDVRHDQVLDAALEKCARGYANGKTPHPDCSKAAVVLDMRSARFFAMRGGKGGPA